VQYESGFPDRGGCRSQACGERRLKNIEDQQFEEK